MIRKSILVKGLVQGVGFRPYVYKIALKNNINGFIKNSSNGVLIDVEGNEEAIDNFINNLKNPSIDILNIEEIIINDKEIANYNTFRIEESSTENHGITFISPDLGICEDCYRDIIDRKNSRYLYPFTNCTNCGPRYSIIKALPYDRSSTTMNSFKMCKSCNEECKDIFNRRFHAQPNCCDKCGPQLELIDKQGSKVKIEDPIKKTIELINEGKILSIKGIGGFHLVCDGKNEYVINSLRKKKNRKTKPFALMMKDIETVKKYCDLSIEEENLLITNKKPIVILNKKGDILPYNIAPNNKTIGVMLPYSPLHYLLFSKELDVLVMTSANLNGMPIISDNKKAINDLANIADYNLINNRDIYNTVDDSIARIILEEERVIRIGRGYSPMYLKTKKFKESLSLGSHLKNTFCFCKDEIIILSQYIGDLDNKETLNRYEMAMNTLKNIYNIEPKLIAYDFHPNIFSNEYLKNFKAKKVGVYHHHAHIASVLFENKVKSRVIGVAYDGTGYGNDGTVWGGEFLIADCKEFKRCGHLNLAAMPGGDKAAIDPMRMAISYFYKVYKDKTQSKLKDISNYNKALFTESKEIKIYIEMIKKDINSPKTSSIGRLFDAVACILGFNKRNTFEGEAAIYLENIALENNTDSYEYGIDFINENYIINTDTIIVWIAHDLKRQIPKEVISMKFHNTIINFTVDVCKKLSKDYGIKEVALSGGVFQNKILINGIYKALEKKSFSVYINKKIPCNDEGISLGQLVIANEREMD